MPRTLTAWTLALAFGLGLGTAFAADRTAAEILKDYDAVAEPSTGRGKPLSGEEVKAFRAASARAAERRAELALELLRSAPDHERLPDLLIPRWIAFMLGAETAPRTVAEIDEALPRFRDPEKRKVARQLKAIATVQSHPDDAPAALPEVERFLADYPGDRLGASLLSGFAQTTRDEAVKRKLFDRLIADYPDSPAAKAAADSIAVLELVGKPFDLKFDDAVTGRPIAGADLKGRVVVLDFWATWCGPCVADMPKMKTLYERHKDRGVEFVGVNLDSEDDDGREKLRAFVAENAIPWPQHHDGKAWESPLVERLGVRAIPALVVIDREGRLAVLDAHGRLDEILPRLLEGPAPALEAR